MVKPTVVNSFIHKLKQILWEYGKKLEKNLGFSQQWADIEILDI